MKSAIIVLSAVMLSFGFTAWAAEPLASTGSIPQSVSERFIDGQAVGLCRDLIPMATGAGPIAPTEEIGVTVPVRAGDALYTRYADSPTWHVVLVESVTRSMAWSYVPIGFDGTGKAVLWRPTLSVVPMLHLLGSNRGGDGLAYREEVSMAELVAMRGNGTLAGMFFARTELSK
jgi:hypothetical protein